MTISRPVSGSTANWMLEPPVSTPTSRMIARAAFAHRLVLAVGQGLGRRHGDRVARCGRPSGRSSRWSRSPRSCRPLSRITSSSYSFQPSTDSSIRTWCTGRELEPPGRRPRRTPPSCRRCRRPVPPRVKEGRITAGSPVSSSDRPGLLEVRGEAALRHVRPMRAIASLKSWRSSPISTARRLAPISRTPSRSSTPRCASSTARLSAVWPPTVGSRASGRSRSRIVSSDLGRERLDVGAVGDSGSVMMVAGFELTSDDPDALALEGLDRLGARSSRTRRPAR